MEPTPYSVLMSRARTGAGKSQLDVPDDWLQGRTLFGGLQAAVASAHSIELPWIPGVTPNFTQHFKARWIVGGPPFTGTSQPDNVIELGMRDSGHATEYHVLAMADFIPPI